MIKCRICLESKRNLCSIFETDQGLSYASMITLLTGIKVVKEQNDLICLCCRRKLNKFYDFKLLIERSDLVLNNQAKVFKFNTIDEIKVEFLPALNYKPETLTSDYNNLFQNNNDCIYYNNTLIKRLNEYEKKNVPIEDFLDTLKSEGVEENGYGTDYLQNGMDKECNYKRKKNTPKISKMNKSTNKTKSIRPTNDVKNICIKPIFLNDVRLLKTSTQYVLKRKKANCGAKSIGTLCPFCGKICKRIKTHILTHVGEKPFKCPKCSNSFYTNPHLQYHMKSHSTIKERFKCEHCILSFSTKGSVMRHMAVHIEYKQFSCPICKKEFRWKSGLKRHMLIHDMAGRSVECGICKMLFYSRSNLKAHSRVHTGERPYNCELCTQPYSYKRDFNRHCLKKHGVIIERRPVHVMNHEVLMKEKSLMKDLMLRLHGIPTESEPMDSFHGPQKALAFAKAVKVMQNGQIPIDVHL